MDVRPRILCKPEEPPRSRALTHMRVASPAPAVTHIQRVSWHLWGLSS